MSYTTKDVDTIVNDILLNILENVDDVTDANVGSVMRQFVESVGIEIEDLYTQVENVYDGSRIDYSTGDDLEQLGKLVGITRRAGTQSVGEVTFLRNTVAGSDFVIGGGVIISTQPNTGSTQLRYTVSSNTTFVSSITDESHEYLEGVDDYALNERFVGNSSSMVITGTLASSPVTFSNTSDYNIVNINDFVEDISTMTTIDDCETADFTEADDAEAATTSTDKKEGTYSLNLGKNGTSSRYATYSKVLGAIVDGTAKDLVLWLYIESQDDIDKINNLYVWLGSGGSTSNSYRFYMSNSELAIGWNSYRLLRSSNTTVTTGSPSLSAINYLKIQIISNASTDTITLGDIKMDYWRFVETETYEGDVVRWLDSGNKPDTTTSFLADYQPFSKEVECVAEYVGDEYNVSKGKIIYKVSNVANINSVKNYSTMSGGSDEEVDADLKERILFATELQGKATAESIRQAILGVSGVTSCSIDDTPKVTTTSEPHLYDTLVDTYKLDNEVLYVDSISAPTNLTITGTVSSSSGYTFMYGTDYIRVTDSYGAVTSEIEWQAAGTKPDDATTFYADYTYDWLGHANAFVVGAETPIPTSISDNIDTAIEESRAAGIVVTWTEPSEVSVDVTAVIYADTSNGYTYSAIESDINDAITTHISSLGAGEDVYIAALYNAIMEVTGVLNTSISAPAADVELDSDEVARIGTITLTEG